MYICVTEMNYKSTKTRGVRCVGRVETVLRDTFTENSVGKSILIDGKRYIVRSIFESRKGDLDSEIRLNVIPE